MKRSISMIDQVEQYLTFRRSLGYALESVGKELILFARYADSIGHQGPVTNALAIEWARLPKEAQPVYWARRLHIVRQFARYAALYDEKTEIPPPDTFGSMKQRLTPHIYTPKQISDLLQAASRLSPQGGLRPLTYVTLFDLLASTGLRISEALALTSNSVDLKNSILCIRQTKFRKDRLVPVHPSTVRKLRQYLRKTEKYRTGNLTGAFFLDENTKPLNYRGVLYRFIQLRKELGWKILPTGRPPRLHDIRHTFAVRRLLEWYRDGHCIDEHILYLSVYLGHACVSDTYWYLTAVPELMELVSERFHKFAYEKGGKQS